MRHESFRHPSFTALLRQHDVALVLSDNPGAWPVFDEVTAPFAYVRLHAHEQLYASGYDDAALDAWAAKVRRWAAMALLARLEAAGLPTGSGRGRAEADPRRAHEPPRALSDWAE